MMMVMMMMDVVMMMVMMMRRRLGVHRSRPGGRAGRCFLRDGVSGEAEREDRRGGKGLDHGGTFLWLGNPNGVNATHRDRRLNSI
jgi:hypothetical protein